MSVIRSPHRLAASLAIRASTLYERAGSERSEAALSSGRTGRHRATQTAPTPIPSLAGRGTLLFAAYFAIPYLQNRP